MVGIKAVRVAVAASVLVSACSTTPVYLADLEAKDYPDTDSVMVQLDCSGYSVTFHVGRGVSNEQEAVEASREEGAREMRGVITKAELRGEHIWVLATEADQVIGALDSRGGIALCVQSVEAAIP